MRDCFCAGFGSDCVMDPWYSLGKADMLDVAHMGLHVGQMSSRIDMDWCFDAITTNSAKILGLDSYGIKKGCRADMVILQATDKIDANLVPSFPTLIPNLSPTYKLIN